MKIIIENYSFTLRNENIGYNTFETVHVVWREILHLGAHGDDIPEHGDNILHVLYLTITCR